MTGYLEQLSLRLAAGAIRLDDDLRTRCSTFFQAAQTEAGGFASRDGTDDLYYSGFALRGLAMLGGLEPELATRAGDYLRARLQSEAPVVDMLSLVYGAALLAAGAGVDVFDQAQPGWPQAVSRALESLRREDGGYAKTDEGHSGSTYQTFLVALCYQLIDVPLIDPDRMAQFVLQRRRDDGGFVEFAQVRRSGTNPTAAAIGLLRILDQLDQDVADDVGEFLTEMQVAEGGFRANSRIPIADVLSTFTATLTLADVGWLDEVDKPAVVRYVQSMHTPGGGFRGGIWDDAPDVEYTFYGLGTLALIADA